MRRFLCGFLIAIASLPLCAADHADVAFLTIDQARAAIVDETIEPYFSLLQPQEMACKTGSVVPGADLAAQRDECRKRYREAARAFSAEEQKAITGVVASVFPYLAETYPRFAAVPWRFVKLDPAIEGGLPHTRGGCIVLSDDVLPMMVGRGGQKLNPQAARLLVHEQMHVLQRTDPQPFATLFTQTWGFVRLAKPPIATPALLSHQLVNPDGVDCGWAFPVTVGGVTTLHQPLVVLGSSAAVPEMPGDFAEVALELVADGSAYRTAASGEAASMPLHELQAYATAFNPSHEMFHPNETSADLFSLMVVRDILGAKSDKEPAAIVGLRAWARTQLAAAAVK
ncbi:MAG: hypothetical protein H0W83_14740 [Planctomycetes bacterium]|nr:hypothetical protein [Planctomycetota bacterium]